MLSFCASVPRSPRRASSFQGRTVAPTGSLSKDAGPVITAAPARPATITCVDSNTFGPPGDTLSFVNDNDTIDVAAQFNSTLEQLAEKVARLPSPDESTPSQRSGRRKSNIEKPQSGYSSRLSEEELELYDTETPDEDWTLEQRALYSLVREHDDDADSTEVFDDMASDVGAMSFPPPRPSPTRLSQADPRRIDAADVQSRLGAVKRRRKRLAAERGEDTFQGLKTELPNGYASEGPLEELLAKRDRANTRVIFNFSLDRSRIIDVREERNAAKSALTSSAEDHLRHVWRIPRAYRPFLGLQDAFFRLDMPTCARCRRRMPASMLQNVRSICDMCYSGIYLQTPLSSTGLDPADGQGPWMREEMKREEEKAAEKAEQVTRQLLNEHTSAMRASAQALTTMSASTNKGTDSEAQPTATSVPTSKKGSGNAYGQAGANGPTPPTSEQRSRRGDGWSVKASDRSLRTINPIRNLIQNIDVKPNPDKELIRLSVGDPTVYGNLRVSPDAVETFCDVIRSGKANGYSMSMGSEMAREAVARRYSSERSPLDADDVILTAGTSGALELALGAIANEGDNVLLPRPGFPLFRTIAEGYGVECRYYAVNPDKSWEIELGDLAKLADERTRAIVVNNPSNPCGSVFSESHVEDLLAAASALKLPIIADEVYADMVFSDQTFTSVGAASVDVPVLCVGGMSKQFVVPGWRLGWVLIHERNGVFGNGEVRKGLRQLTTRMLVPNTPAQHVLPTLLNIGMGDLMRELEANAEFTMQSLQHAAGVRVVRPQGAMYVMAEIDVERLGFKDDMEFVRGLLEEEAVFVLPGQCFQAKNFVRIVFSAPQNVLSEAFFRIRSFCARRSGGI